MTLADLLSELDHLDRDDRLRVIDHLIAELEKEEADTPSIGESNGINEAVEDAAWEASFAKSQDLLTEMAARTRRNRAQGLNRELDPDTL